MVEKKDGFSIKGLLWAVAILVVVPNIFFGGLASHLELGRPVLNVDYAFASVFILLNQRLVAVILTLVAFFFDALALIGQIFPVLHFSGIFYISKFIGMAPLFYQAVILSVIFFAIVNAYLMFRLPHKSSKESLVVVVNIVMAAYFVQVFWGGERDDRVWRVAEGVAVDSQTVFAFDSRGGGFVKTLKADGRAFADVKSPGATSAWFSAPLQLNDKVLLIVSESWGSTDKAIIQALLKPLRDQSDQVQGFATGEIDFSGLTIAAELRELCRWHPLHFNFSHYDESLKGCLPNILKKQGYKTYAMHGAAGLMYDRIKWYPKVGFEESTFFESRPWEKRCYSFPGACDSELMSELGDVFVKNEKTFFYWLTLNTHSKYDKRDIEIDVFECEEFGIKADSQTCRNLKLHAQFFHYLAGVVEEPYMEGVEVMIVGDHEPPIINKLEKDKYYKSGTVPWVKFYVNDSSEISTEKRGVAEAF